MRKRIQEGTFELFSHEHIEWVRAQLSHWAKSTQRDGSPTIAAEGKLLRPLVADAIARAMALPDSARADFWKAVLALQMVHEASLLHDDIIDEAAERRGKPTLFALKGTSTALVMGDWFLTGSYALLSEVKNLPLIGFFTDAVERTVAGECKQAQTTGQVIDMESYKQIIVEKSGFLFGFATAIAPCLQGDVRSEQLFELGKDFGMIYQMLDDLLDYCPKAETGKPAFQDHLQKKPTWPWLVQEEHLWSGDSKDIHASIFGCPQEGAVKRQKLVDFFQMQCLRLQEKLRSCLQDEARGLCDMIDQWLHKGLSAIQAETPWVDAELSLSKSKSNREKETFTPSKKTLGERITLQKAPALVQSCRAKLEVLLAKEGLDRKEHWDRYFSHHSRSFSFASRFFPAAKRAQIAGVYAYSRFTDDLVDEQPHLTVAEGEDLLAHWKALSLDAHSGKSTGLYLLDHVMGEMGEADVPFRYAGDLIAGVQMDLTQKEYTDLNQLLLYSYRVASTIGLWLTELFGVKEPWVLRRAAALGEAMQVTNILRDVGEDLRNGRVYLPADMMAKYGLDRDSLQKLHDEKKPVPEHYCELIEELMFISEQRYREAFPGIPSLPDFFQKPVVIAAYVYRGIHDEIRANCYDNLHLRGSTSLSRKLWLTWRALQDMKLERRRIEQRKASNHPAALLSPNALQWVPVRGSVTAKLSLEESNQELS